MILIVEDDVATLSLLELVCQSRDIEYRSATRVRDALWIMRDEHPTGLLVDLWLPDGTAKDVIERFLCFRPKESVIVISALSVTEIKVLLEAIQVGLVLPKPFSLEALELAIDSLK